MRQRNNQSEDESDDLISPTALRNANISLVLSQLFVVYSSHSVAIQIDQSITHRGFVLSDWSLRLLLFLIRWRVNMVTVIADQEELTTPVHNGGQTGSNDREQTLPYIKDYQEVRDERSCRRPSNECISFQVDFHRSPSCKPLPEDLFGTVDDPQMRSSVGHSDLSTVSVLFISNPRHEEERNERSISSSREFRSN